MDSIAVAMQANRKRIEKNAEKIMDRRANILKNASNISKNQERVISISPLSLGISGGA